MKEIVGFKLNSFIEAANELMRADETANALWLLEKGLPAYYRDHVPKEVQDLKREIMARLATASFYATSTGYELTAPQDAHLQMHLTMRGHQICRDVKNLNDNDLMPHILDLGPGEYWLPRMLQHQQLLFSYQPIFVNHPSHEHYRQHWNENAMTYHDRQLNPPHGTAAPKILFAGEIIEHLWNEDEIRFEMERHVGLADIVHVSTPLYTFDYQCQDWRSKGDIGHLRTYTPGEFNLKLLNMFREYEVTTYVSQILHGRAVLRNTPFEAIKNFKMEL